MTDTYVTKDSFWHSLSVQVRVVRALVFREMLSRFGRSNLGFLWLFFEPMLFCLAVTFVWIFIREKGVEATLSIPAFALTGYCAKLLWRNVSSRCSTAIEPNARLLYHRNVRVIDLFYSRIILEIMGLTGAFVFLCYFFAAMSWCELPRYPALVIAGWLFMAWFSVGLGLLVGAIAGLFESFARFWRVFVYLMFPLSGAVFMVDWLPPPAREFVLWLPMVHATEMIRHGFFGEAVRTYEDPLFLAFANLFFMTVGLALVRATDRRVSPV